MTWLDIAIRLGVAAGAGMAIGIERELRHKVAGLRTHMLVAIGTASIMIVALQMDQNASRVVQGIVTGIGFIGAGTILRDEGHIEGVTTAAGIWACTMIGVAAGNGYYKVTVIALFFVLFTLVGCVLIERLLHAKDSEVTKRAGGSDRG
ncbi:MAG TPA: MgtC/SapB family protein [Stellaceae bacterium]|nr:MgtC/SapB family protein [Stellaceae bacterium]